MHSKQLMAAIVAAAGLAGAAQADFMTGASVIARSLDSAPGTGGAFYAGANSIGSVQVDGTGRVYYVGTLFVAAPVTNITRTGIWSGTTSADNALVVRDGDQVQGQAAGVVFNTSASVGGLGTSPFRTTANGAMWGGQMVGPGIVANVNDTGLFTGTAAGYSTQIRRGEAAPGTAGAVWALNFKSVNTQLTGLNNSSKFVMQATLSGGDVSGSTNNTAIYTGGFGSLGLVARKGDALGGGLTLNALDFNAKINSANQVFFDGKVAGAGITTANDSRWWLHTPGSGNTVIYAEGAGAVGTVGATFSGSASVSARSYSSAGMLFAGTLAGGDVVTGVNDTAIYRTRAGGMDMVVRKGAAAAGTGGVFASFSNQSLSMTNNGRIAFQSGLSGGTITTANDYAMWGGAVDGSLEKIFQKGDIAVGTLGAIMGSNSGQSIQMNGLGQVLFTVSLSGGDVTAGLNDNALFVWDRSAGLQLVTRKGDAFTVAPGDVRIISSWSVQGNENADGGCSGFNDSGVVGMRLVFTDSTDAVVRLTSVPTPGSLGVMAVGVLALGRRRRN